MSSDIPKPKYVKAQDFLGKYRRRFCLNIQPGKVPDYYMRFIGSVFADVPVVTTHLASPYQHLPFSDLETIDDHLGEFNATLVPRFDRTNEYNVFFRDEKDFTHFVLRWSGG